MRRAQLTLVVSSVVALASLTFASAFQTFDTRGRPEIPIPVETAGWDAVVTNLLSAFDTFDVVMLGEAYGRKVDADLRLRLVRHPDFRKKVKVIVAEVLTEQQQPLVDRYIRGDEMTEPAMKALRTLPAMYVDLLTAIRDINRPLPPSEQIRVLAGSPSPNTTLNANARPVAVIREEVLMNHQHVLALYGAGMVWRNQSGITRGLQRVMPTRIFVAEGLGPIASAGAGPEAVEMETALRLFDGTLESRERPVLVVLKGRPTAAAMLANPFYLGEAMLPPNITIGDNDDAVIYFGRGADVGAVEK